MATKIGSIKGNTGQTGDTGATGPQGATGAVGLPTISSDSGNTATLGSDSKLFVPSPSIALASPSGSGLVRQLSGKTTDFVDGSNHCQDLGSAVRPVVWSVRQRSYNTIHNPNFYIDSRKIHSQQTPIPNGFICDRWIWNQVGASLQVFGNSAYWAGLTSYAYVLSIGLYNAQATLAAGDYGYVYQWVEGPNLGELMGAPHSISLMLSWVVGGSPPPLHFSVSLRDSPATKSWTHLCTLPSTGAATTITIPNIPPFPSGNFSTAPGNAGYILGICFGAGSTFTAPVADTWVSGNYLAAPGTDNWFNLGGYLYIYLVQHEPGPDSTPFIDKPFQQNWDECQRYYQKNCPYGTKCPGAATIWHPLGYLVSNVVRLQNCKFPVRMAKTPTITIYDASGPTANSIHVDYIGPIGISSYNWTSPSAGGAQDLAQVTLVSTPSAPIGTSCLGQWQADTGW